MTSSTHASVTVAQQLQQDPRVQQAKQLLMEALLEHRAKIDSVRGGDPALTESYQEMLATYGQMRGGNLYFPYLGSGLGNGSFVELADGSVKLDFITGIGVHGLGHSPPPIAGIGRPGCGAV